MSLFSFFSALLPAALQAGLLMILVRRRLYRTFPFFSAYTLYSVAVTVVWLSATRQPVAFFVLYWTTQMIYGLLALLAILEVFRPTLGSYFGQAWSRWVLPLALLAIVVIALWRAFYHPIGRGGSLRGLASGAYAFMMGILSLEIVVFAVCLRLAYRKPYPVRWGRYRLGILAGFGLAACASAAAYIVQFIFGTRYEVVFHYVLPGAYIGATMGWLFAFWRPEPPRSGKPMEVYKRAAGFATRAAEDAEKDLGLHASAAPFPLQRRSQSLKQIAD